MKYLIFLILFCQHVVGDPAAVQIDLDTSEVPHLNKWASEARSLMLLWHPLILNQLDLDKTETPQKIILEIKKSYEGIAACQGSTITVSSSWIEKHPEDYGVVLHELIHVIQAYPPNDHWWLTEGIADYFRWAMYENKKQEWFPRPKEAQGYRKGYHIAAGFLLWIESYEAPGMIKKLNAAMRDAKYNPKLFKVETGLSLDELWHKYTSQSP